MVDSVLVAMDDSVLSEHALEFALESYPDAAITVLHVVGEPSIMMGESVALMLEDDIDVAAEEQSQQVFARAREIAGDRDLTTTYAIGHPARAIVRRSADYDVVVVGSHGSDVADRLFVGDVARTVFRRAPIPVTVVR